MSILLILCGDIELNPGPIPRILQRHLREHQQRHKTYFILGTIKIQPEYQHTISSFIPHLKISHPLYPQSTISHPHLYQFIQTLQEHPIPRILYALIITFYPKPNIYNIILAQNMNQPWTQTLLTKLH
jgi:hypothetical protein